MSLYDENTNPEDTSPYREQFVQAVRDLVKVRKIDRKNGITYWLSASDSDAFKKFTQTEIKTVIKGWKDYADGGIKRPPPRWQIINLADYFHCTTRERNALLVAAGYKPEDEFIDDKRTLARLLKPHYEIMEQTYYPCYIVNKDWSILAISSTALKFFGITKSLLLNFPKEHLNIISLLLYEYSPIRDMIIAQGELYWWQVVYRNIMGFKAENELCLYDEWFIKTIERFRQFPEFRKIYDDGYKPIQNMKYWTEYLTSFKRDGITLTARSVIAKAGDDAHPQIVYYVPGDLSTKQWFIDELKIKFPTKPKIYSLYDS